MDFTTLVVDEPRPHVCRVTLNRPEAANAVDATMLAELFEIAGQIGHDPGTRVWLLAGAPRPDGRPWFSAGADLKAMSASSGPSRISGSMVTDRIDDLLTPSIAVIDGFCTTGALELAMACDLRVASKDARLSDWHLERFGSGLGGWGAATRLSRLVGVAKATEILLTSAEVDGAEAERIGLVNRAVESAALMDTALALAERIAGMSPEGVRTTLGFLSTNADMAKAESLRWSKLITDFMGSTREPTSEAARRYLER